MVLPNRRYRTLATNRYPRFLIGLGMIHSAAATVGHTPEKPRRTRITAELRTK